MLRRLGSTGLFQDPNDMCLMLVMAMVICVYESSSDAAGSGSAPLALFGHALMLDALAGRVPRAAGRRAGLLARAVRPEGGPAAALVVLPVLFVLFAGRQTDLTISGEHGPVADPALVRGDGLCPPHPLFGIGSDRYDDYVGHVAHNSFIHAYTELGFLGGTLFLGMFYLAVLGLCRLGSTVLSGRRSRPAAAAAVRAGDRGRLRGGMMSLSCATRSRPTRCSAWRPSTSGWPSATLAWPVLRLDAAPRPAPGGGQRGVRGRRPTSISGSSPGSIDDRGARAMS